MTTVNVDPETGEILDIEGDLPDERAVVPLAPRGLAVAETPKAMIGLASELATALADIVERQKLYATISGKKYPQVEAWATIGRLDNVVAQEVTGGIVRHDDGSYEATVELIRLSDGMVVGRGSAICGTQGDRPWDSRGEPQRRSMAVTRATSRAFRQQYSWIMALAGYEPTPADEMPAELHDAPRSAPAPVPQTAEQRPPAKQRNTDVLPGEYVGTVSAGKPPVDLELRETPDGWVTGFKLDRIQVVAEGALAQALQPFLAELVGQEVTVWGRVEYVDWEKGGQPMRPYRRLHLDRIKAAEFTLPAETPPRDELGPDFKF